MTHVADDVMLGKFVRRIKGLVERAIAGSLDIEKLWDVVQGYLDGKLANIEGVLSGTHEIKSKTTLLIDRTKPFDPVAFIGEGWKIEEQDERSLALSEFDLTAVRFKTMLEGRENWVKGETKLARLKNAGHIRLDAKILQVLWENKILIPKDWKKETNGNITYIFFDGTILQNSRGARFTLSLHWNGGAWCWVMNCLEKDCSSDCASAVMASQLAA